MKKSLGVFINEDADSLKESLLKSGINSETSASKWIDEDNLKYAPIYTSPYDSHPENKGLERASLIEVLVEETDLQKALVIRDSLEFASVDTIISKIQSKFNVSNETVAKTEDFLKAFDLTGANMSMNEPSGLTGHSASTALSTTDTAFLNFVFNKETKDYFKHGFGRKLFIGFIIEIIVTIFLLIDPLHWFPVNSPTGFIILFSAWYGFFIMSFPYRQRFGPRIASIYLWIINILALGAIILFITKK